MFADAQLTVTIRDLLSISKTAFRVFLVTTLLSQSLAFGAPVHAGKCEDLFLATTLKPKTVEEKLAFIEFGIRSSYGNAFKDMDITQKNGVSPRGLEKLVSLLDFERLTKNQILLILSRVSLSPLPLHRQLILRLQGKKYLVQNDLDTVSFANDLMRLGLMGFVDDIGQLQERGFRDHFMIYVQKYFPFIRMALTSVDSVFSLLQVASLSSKFKSTWNPEFDFMEFKDLSAQAQQDIFINGFIYTQDNTRISMGRRPGLALGFQMTARLLSVIFAMIALTMTLDQMHRKIAGMPPSHYFEDLIDTKFFEEATLKLYESGMIGAGLKVDEEKVRALIHKEVKRVEQHLDRQN